MEKPFILIYTDDVSAYSGCFIEYNKYLLMQAHVFMSLCRIAKTMHTLLIQAGDSADQCRDVASLEQC